MPSVPVRVAARVGGAFALTAAMLTAGTAPASAVQVAVDECSAEYAVLYEWGGGFAAEVTLTSDHETVRNWMAQWDFSQGQQVRQAWNAEIYQYGSRVEASDAGIPWNGDVSGPTAVSFGFVAEGPTEVPDNLECWVNPYRLW